LDVRRFTLRLGQLRPRQRNAIFAPFGALWTTSFSRRLNVGANSHWLATTAPRSANGSARRSQFSSTRFPRISRAVGRIAALLSSQSIGRGKPSPSTSRFALSRPSQFSSMPLLKI
jgi:hypothetical protein